MTTAPDNRLSPIRHFFKWLLLASMLGLLVGAACALFLHALEWATNLRFMHPWLIWWLPVAVALMALIYKVSCKKSDQGNNLIIEEIHQPGGGVPARMAPLVLAGTLVAHLTGASVGREGTAVQMGGSIAGGLGRRFRQFIQAKDMPVLLMAGVAGGFGGVFGTPLAGAVFAAEVLTRGHAKYRVIEHWKIQALIPCLIASFTADFIVRHLGVHHMALAPFMDGLPGVSWLLALQVLIATLCFGCAAAAFVQLSHAIKALLERATPHTWLRAALGGLATLALVYLAGTHDYLGLGTDSPDPQATTLFSCFFIGGAALTAWLWKMVFTATAVGSGIKGGEVTPLFFIGAALGNALATQFTWWTDRIMGQYPVHLKPAPVELFAALGMVAVFAAATNAPLACTLMGMEIFGAKWGGYFAVACFGAYLISGKKGIYTAQKE